MVRWQRTTATRRVRPCSSTPHVGCRRQRVERRRLPGLARGRGTRPARGAADAARGDEGSGARAAAAQPLRSEYFRVCPGAASALARRRARCGRAPRRRPARARRVRPAQCPRRRRMPHAAGCCRSDG
eukprot:5289949-Prymnesium_polylepis.1